MWISSIESIQMSQIIREQHLKKLCWNYSLMMQQHETARNIPHSHIPTLDILPTKKKKNIMESPNEFLTRPHLNYLGGCPSLHNSQPAWTAVGPVLHGFVLWGWEHSENIALRTCVSHSSTCWRRRTGLVTSTKWMDLWVSRPCGNSTAWTAKANGATIQSQSHNCFRGCLYFFSYTCQLKDVSVNPERWE